MYFWPRSLFALSQNATSGEWTNEEICLGGSDQCHNGLIGHHFGHVLSFAEDTDGEHHALAVGLHYTSPLLQIPCIRLCPHLEIVDTMDVHTVTYVAIAWSHAQLTQFLPVYSYCTHSAKVYFEAFVNVNTIQENEQKVGWLQCMIENACNVFVF